MIGLVLKKNNTEDEKEEGEKGESQKESSQLSSEKCSLWKTDTNNQRQDQDIAAPESESTEEGKCRENKFQSGNPDSKPKATVTKIQNLGMRSKEQKSASVAKMQQHFKSFDGPHHSPFLTFPPRPPLFLYPGSGPSYNMCIPPFSDSLLFTLHRATEEKKQNKPW